MKQILEENDKNFFAKEIARKICSKNKQNAIILCTGAMGTGKSWTVIELAIQIAFYVAQKKGGKPEDYFTMDNVGIMVMDEIAQVYERMDKTHHCIYIVDDAGATFNARRFSSDNNIAQNDRIQTMRPHSNVVIFTTPIKSLMDKVVRNLSTYHIYMKEPMFEIGFTTCDIRKIEIDLASDKERVFRKYLQNHRGDKYKLHMFKAPPKSWTDEYDRRREIAEAKLAEKSRETVAKANEMKVPKKKKIEEYKEFLSRFHKGEFGELSLRQACIENGLPYQQVIKAKAE